MDFGGATAQQTDASGVAVETCIQREQQSRDIEMNDDDSSATSEKHENYKEMVGRQGSEVYNGIVKLPEGKTLKDYLYFF